MRQQQRRARAGGGRVWEERRPTPGLPIWSWLGRGVCRGTGLTAPLACLISGAGFFTSTWDSGLSAAEEHKLPWGVVQVLDNSTGGQGS